MRGTAVAACGLVLCLGAAGARAHGRFPEAGQIVFHPADPQTIVVRTTFGLLVTRDGGGEWRWICAPVMGARMTEDPKIAVTPDGAIVAAMFGGLARGTDMGCSWGIPDPDLDDTVVIDQAPHPTDPAALFAVTSNGSVDNVVYRSGDQGVSWEPTGEPIEPILFETIAVAPTDPSRLYLSGAYPPTGTDPRLPFLHRSSDGGETWERFAFETFTYMPDQNVFLLGVSPTDPDDLFLRVKSEEADRVVRSHDGGETWSEVLSLPAVLGFAWSADGGTVWVGGNEGSGLYRSSDGGASFTHIREDLEVSCLAARGDELWACGNNYTDGFAVGRSTDGGESFETVLLFQQVSGMVECPAGSDTPTQCGPLYPDLVLDLGLTDGGVPGADAGAGGGGGGDGCTCRSTPGRGGAGGAALLGVLSALHLRRRRRRG